MPEQILKQIVPLLAVLLVLALLSRFLLAKKSRSHFRRRTPFLSPAERSFAGVLRQATQGRYLISCKVRLADIVKPEPFNISDFNRVAMKHVDFVLCDPETWEVLAVIELDDKSHGKTDRKERDSLIDDLFKEADIPVVRFKAKTAYTLGEVQDTILKLTIDDQRRAVN